ncbi:hypothetical protein HPB51_017761 [Rhipicephalus microplus]|uniref:Uncharacterized protein n=1 Tax=Rhipicephalus microplus TaxID=6941 RepID=A0A9J6ENS9_RHIMP|nr:hypothetical protein HPB51_017761 [Rhipicephalus microplus]
MTKHYNLRDRERDKSEMNGDGAGNLQALGVVDSGMGGHGSGTSDTASEQQHALLQLQLKIAEAETEKQRLMLESQRLQARNGAESNESDDSVALGGRVKRDIVSDECSAVEETEAIVELSDEACEEQQATAGVITAESNSEGSEPVKSKRQEFREAQEADPALRDAWAQAKARTHGMLVKDELLYHQEYLAGRICKELALPRTGTKKC